MVGMSTVEYTNYDQASMITEFMHERGLACLTDAEQIQLAQVYATLAVAREVNRLFELLDTKSLGVHVDET